MQEKNPQLNVEDEVIMIGWGEWGCLLTRMSAKSEGFCGLCVLEMESWHYLCVFFEGFWMCDE